MKQVLLVDDHPVYMAGVQQILSSDSSLQMMMSTTGTEAIDKVKEQNWDLIILDISLPDRNGLDVLKHIKANRPQTPVLVLTIHNEEQYALRVLKAGASGFLTKSCCGDDLRDAVGKVLKGGRFVGSQLAEKISLSAENKLPAAHETLSDREMQVLCMIASGKGVKEIGEDLQLSVKTVSTYRARILEKLGKSNNAELIQFAILNRLVPEIPISGRRYERHQVKVKGSAEIQNQEWQFDVWNISLGGACIDTEAPLNEGELIDLSLVAPDQETLRLKARVIWKVERRFGLMFSELPEKMKKIIYRWTRR
jgi:two-component system, NarL family, invasion response regulator UvrY